MEIISKGVDSFPGVVELIHNLKSINFPIAIASGALHQDIAAFLKALDLQGVFSVVIAADDVSRSKPDPETYLTAFDRLKKCSGLSDLSPNRCIAIEDTPAGIQSAKDAGLFVLAVTNSFPPERLIAADHIVESLSEINVDRLNQLIIQSIG